MGRSFSLLRRRLFLSQRGPSSDHRASVPNRSYPAQHYREFHRYSFSSCFLGLRVREIIAHSLPSSFCFHTSPQVTACSARGYNFPPSIDLVGYDQYVFFSLIFFPCCDEKQKNRAATDSPRRVANSLFPQTRLQLHIGRKHPYPFGHH